MTTKYDFTAIIYDKKGNILSIGKNSYVKTHPLQARTAKKVGEPEKIFLHAEISAIVKCRNIDKAHKIVVFRFDKKGKPAMAKPCKVCADAIKNQTPIQVIEHT